MKLQPNFSWQKYEGTPEDQKEQFQFQLQQQHISVANSINATIDDGSFWLRERATAFTWVNNKQIYTKTVATVAWTAVGTINTIPLGIVGDFVVIDFVAAISNGTLSTNSTLPLPYVNVTALASCISLVRSGTNIVITSGGVDRSAYSGYVTVYYIKT
jgi:hypothetical protein